MSKPDVIELSSDTATRPTAAMRAAIAAAEVGDEQKHADPTVIRLTDRVAELLGKEAALFLPSGTMCNVLAVRTHTRPGDLMLAERDAHVLRSEGGGAGMISGVMCDSVQGQRGIFDVAALDEALAHACALPSPYGPKANLLCVEQTHNLGGGSIWPIDTLHAVTDLARERGMALHMDGARLPNAAVASGRSMADHAAPVDTAWIDFSKGLGAPMGAVLAGPREFIAEARRYRQMLGGALRQAGIAAAACLYALDHHVERLAEDHANARRLAEGLAGIDGIRLAHGMPQTNIVYFDVGATGLAPAEFVTGMAQRGLRLSAAAGLVRAVTHLDVSTAQIDEALQRVAGYLRKR